ncbi:MAG: restriction endonuclease, partial [Candidatus Levybacteria bacterium]|nr:restriction endonuclease [Candidatus Levybacteria bacterium]
AITFGMCAGMHILSWEYPTQHSFRDIVEQAKLIPITALTTLNRTQEASLLEQGVVLVKDIVTNNSVLDPLHLPKERTEDILTEAKQIVEN